MDAGLLAHWPFEDGSSVKIEGRIRLGGTEDFTIALWAKTDAILDDVLGDPAAWYDPPDASRIQLGNHDRTWRHFSSAQLPSLVLRH